MAIKSIGSTEAQNNFGRVLDDVTLNNTRYVIRRRGAAQAVLLSVADLTRILGVREESQQMRSVLRELRPIYALGQEMQLGTEQEQRRDLRG